MRRSSHRARIGVAPITKFVFSREDALRCKQEVLAKLRQSKVDFVDLEGITPDGTLWSRDQLPAVIEHFRRADVAALFCPHCNFGTEDVAALLGREMKLPYLLWGPRDEAPVADGTRLRDTQCGLFATSRILNQLGVPFTYIPNCRVDAPALERGVLDFVRVAAVCEKAHRMRIGQVGQRVDFFWSVMIDEADLMSRCGIEVLQVYEAAVFDRMQSLIDSQSPEMAETEHRLRNTFALESLDDRRVRAICALKLALTEIAEREELSAVALQCFPTLQERFGIYPCGAHSLLSDEGVPVICETDIHGAITAALLQAAALDETPPFFADLTIRHPGNDNAELLWHCGSFPVSLSADSEHPKLGEHFIMPGDAAGVGHWRIRGGDVTLARFARSEEYYGLAFGEGVGTDGPATVGTYLWLQVRNWLDWETKFIRGPYIHHVAAVHGRFAPVLHEACRYIPWLSPDPIDPTAEELERRWWQEA